MSRGPKRRTVVDTVSVSVKRTTAAVGYAAGFSTVTIPCVAIDFVSVTEPDTKEYATPVAAFVYVASGTTVVHDIHHIDRGYERIEERLEDVRDEVIERAKAVDKKVRRSVRRVAKKASEIIKSEDD